MPIDNKTDTTGFSQNNSIRNPLNRFGFLFLVSSWVHSRVLIGDSSLLSQHFRMIIFIREHTNLCHHHIWWLKIIELDENINVVDPYSPISDHGITPMIWGSKLSINTTFNSAYIKVFPTSGWMLILVLVYIRYPWRYRF